MCGIAGMIDLSGQRPVPAGAVAAMAEAIVHRGPDEDGFFDRPGLAMASRRLSIVGLFDGRQPIHNEDRSVSVVFNGELFEYPELKKDLESRGHRFATHCDTEVIPHLWEEYEEGLFDRLRGQFAFALWDERRQRLILGRDRFGICPLYWTRVRHADGEWLLFASEIKALLASGMVEARPERRGINHLFTFFALPGPYTCFEGIHTLLPGHYLRVQPGESTPVRDHTYFEPDFPDAGHEEPVRNSRAVVDGLEEVMLRAVERRLRADVPVVSYLSGGVDSSTVVALAGKVRGTPIPTFTIRIDEPTLDETAEASVAARHVGTEPIVVNVGDREVLATYPRLIQAAEGPVVDTSCAALLLLAEEVHRRGYKVALTGEGADEWLAGYPWYKINRLFGFLDVIPGLPLGQAARRAVLRVSGQPLFPKAITQRSAEAVGGYNAWMDIYGLMSTAKLRFYSAEMKEALADHVPYADFGANLDRVRKWHPLNRSLYWGVRVHLPGLLLSLKGDRIAMHSSVETRYPFLDEDVYAYLAKLPPSWKMRGFRDKYVLRLLAERWLPKSIAWRRKAMFRAPFDSFFATGRVPTFVDHLLSEESLRRTNYFDHAAVDHWRRRLPDLRRGSLRRTSVEMGLVGVVATQLWHHTFVDGSLTDLPTRAKSGGPFRAEHASKVLTG